MARRRKSGIAGLLSGKMMWYAIYGVAGYFAYQYIGQLRQVSSQTQPSMAPQITQQ